MTRQRFFVTFAITFAVAGLPLSGLAAAQDRTSNGNTTGSAVPRGGGDGGGTATPRGGDGGGASGGSSSSSGGGGSVSGSGWTAPSSTTSTPSTWSSFEAPSRSNEQSSRPRGGSTSTGTATPRSGGSSGGSSTRSGGSTASGRSASSGSDDSGPSRRAVPVYSRPRDGRPITGEVVERGTVPPAGGGGGGIYYPYYPYYPWGFWGPGYGYGLGYLYYDPFFGGGYGYGYGDPGYGGGGGYSVSQSYRDNGSLRLKISPKQAQVYIDGYFVGVVDSYDGAFQKLGLEGGGHRVELKADGFEPLQFEVLITPGETVTYKGEMKRIQ